MGNPNVAGTRYFNDGSQAPKRLSFQFVHHRIRSSHLFSIHMRNLCTLDSLRAISDRDDSNLNVAECTL